MRKPFILFRRLDGGALGKEWYVGFWDQDQYTYIDRRATGQTSKALAELVAKKWLDDGRPGSGASQNFLEYLETFWADDGEYAKSKEIRERSLSKAYLENNRAYIKNHVKPFLEKNDLSRLQLSRVTPRHLEVLIFYVRDGSSSRTANQVRQAVAVPLSHANKMGIIPTNPAEIVEKLPEKKLERRILTPDETREFFSRVWIDRKQRTINLLAATTGMRLGECLGLLKEDLRGDFIHVCHNWQDREGLKAPKWGSVRDVPIPSKTREALDELLALNDRENNFVFYGWRYNRPMGGHTVTVAYNQAIIDLGIKEEDRKARGLTFHSWRHWYNSMMRGPIDEHTLRSLTGHRSEAMTDYYTEITEDQRKKVLALAEELI
jgi:integrase